MPDSALIQTDQQNQPKSKPKRRKLTLEDANEIADRVIRFRMNETEACRDMGIEPHQWFVFKQRKKVVSEFESMQDTIRAAQLRNCIGTIDNHGDGIEYTALNKSGEVVTLTKPGDWRAKAWIAERVLSPERFGDSKSSAATVQVNVLANIDIPKLIEVARKQVEAERQAKALPVVSETKMLPKPE